MVMTCCTYGSPRVVRHAVLDAGFACGENRQAWLLKTAGIKVQHKRRRSADQLEAAHVIARIC
jgi:hypothetical protein